MSESSSASLILGSSVTGRSGRNVVAVAVERAGVGVVAVLADGDRRRLGDVEHGEHLGDQPGDQREVGAGVGGDVLGDEEPLEVVVAAVVDVGVVEVHEVGAADRQAGALEHPHLHGDVGDVDVLDPGARLDLVEVPEVLADAHEHVGAHEDATVLERGLEDRARRVLEEPARGLERLRGLGVVLGDEHSAGEALARQFPDRVAGVEDVLLRLRRRVGQLASVRGQPQRLAALQAGLEPRFGQAIRHVCHLLGRG